MAKFKPFSLDKLIKQFSDFFSDNTLETIAEEIKRLLKKEYEAVIAEIGTPQYTPLHNTMTYRGQTYNPNLKSQRTGNYYREKFEQREALYETMEVDITYRIDRAKKTITFGATVGDGKGHANNVFYWLDLGTTSKPQNRSPFIRGASYVEQSTGIAGRGYSRQIADRVQEYVKKNYKKNIKIEIPDITTKDVDWNNSPLTKKLPKP